MRFLAPPGAPAWRAVAAGATALALDTFALRAMEAQRADMWAALEGGSDAPVLLAHSLDDELAPAADVARFAGALRARGRGVRQLSFPSSPHVGHLRAHPAAYDAGARAWVQDALAHWRASADARPETAAARPEAAPEDTAALAVAQLAARL